MSPAEVRKMTAVLRILRRRQGDHKQRLAKSKGDEAGKEFWRGAYHGTKHAADLIETALQSLKTVKPGAKPADASLSGPPRQGARIEPPAGTPGPEGFDSLSTAGRGHGGSPATGEPSSPRRSGSGKKKGGAP